MNLEPLIVASAHYTRTLHVVAAEISEKSAGRSSSWILWRPAHYSIKLSPMSFFKSIFKSSSSPSPVLDQDSEHGRSVPAEELLAKVASKPSAPTKNDDPVDIEVSVTPEVPAFTASSEHTMFVNVSIQSHDVEVADKLRVGVDLVTILDKSGSMSGEKERLLRNAMEFVIGELGEKDRLCTIAFDSSAHFEHGFVTMGAAGKSTALHHVQGPGLNSGGCTDIFDGLQLGVAALNQRKTSNAVTTIFLLTDGIDNANLDKKLELAREARRKGWFMFIFAFGNDHDAGHLRQIADAADSSYVFIDNLATVREAFGGAIGSQQGVAGKLLSLSIQAADPDVQITRARAGQYEVKVSADGRMAVVTYPNLLIGEKRDCCIELILPEVSSSVESTAVLNASLTYTPISSTGTDEVTVISPGCSVSRPAAIDVPMARNEIVDAQINRLKGIDAIAKATALANSNHLEEARAEIMNAKLVMVTSSSATNPSTVAMVTELEDCVGRLQTSHEWASGGMAEQMESLNVHQAQRGVYAKKSKYCDSRVSSASAYSNNYSKACQKKASLF